MLNRLMNFRRNRRNRNVPMYFLIVQWALTVELLNHFFFFGPEIISVIMMLVTYYTAFRGRGEYIFAG